MNDPKIVEEYFYTEVSIPKDVVTGKTIFLPEGNYRVMDGILYRIYRNEKERHRDYCKSEDSGTCDGKCW